jgi:hypothetical protein
MEYDAKSTKRGGCYIQYCEVDYDQKGKYELQYAEITEYVKGYEEIEGGEQIVRGTKPWIMIHRAWLSFEREEDAQYQESVRGITGITGCDVLHSENENWKRTEM